MSDDLIPDRTEIPAITLPPLLWAGIVLLVAFAALGIYSESVHEKARTFALLSRWENTPYYGTGISWVVHGLLAQLMEVIPFFSGCAMLWIAFLNPRWSDRMLWSAAMIFSSFVVAVNIVLAFPHKAGAEVYRTYPDASVVVGLIAYVSWIFVIPESSFRTWTKRILTLLCVLAIIILIVFPFIDEYTRLVDMAGGVLLAAALFAFGLAVARRVGVDLLGRHPAIPPPHQQP